MSFCAEKNVKEPTYAWSPTIAPSGLDYYKEGRISEWNNSLLVAILKDKKLIQLKLNGDGTKVEMAKDYFTNQFGRLRDIAVSPEGNVYISTDNGEHKDMIIEVIKR